MLAHERGFPIILDVHRRDVSSPFTEGAVEADNVAEDSRDVLFDDGHVEGGCHIGEPRIDEGLCESGVDGEPFEGVDNLLGVGECAVCLCEDWVGRAFP